MDRTLDAYVIHVCRSPEWTAVPDDEKKELGLSFDFDGEFWCVDYHQFSVINAARLVHSSWLRFLLNYSDCLVLIWGSIWLRRVVL